MERRTWTIAVGAMMLWTVGAFLGGCGGSGSHAPVPVIQNINSSTAPTSPVNLPIEINGSGFQAAPGKVVFTQGNITATVVPNASGWTDTGIIAVVPAGNGNTNFTLPGIVSVTVVTSGGTSNAINLNLIQTLTFNPSLMSWTTTTPLAKALTGLRAVAVPGSTSSTAFAIVTGGYDSAASANSNLTYSDNLNADGTVGSATNVNWTTISASSLPDTRAHHAMAEADPTNSLVAVTARVIYVIGGQKLSTDAPGGTNTVFMASVDPTAGTVGTWQALSSTLPQSLVGLSATAYNGYLYVAGGLNTNGAPQSTVYSAPINADGTLGSWTMSQNPLPTATAFGSMFAFGGKLYFIDGDPNNSTTPNNQGVGTTNVYFADIVRGVVGMWTQNPSLTIHDRAKGILWSAFGQVISGEGIYSGNAGGCPASGETEVSTVHADGTLSSWNGLTGSNVPCANLYNGAAFVSPLISAANTPRFLLLGGQAFTGTTGPGGTVSSTVYVNSAP